MMVQTRCKIVQTHDSTGCVRLGLAGDADQAEREDAYGKNE